jgi:TFIIF-interacting CTD phosphatase-like protein
MSPSHSAFKDKAKKTPGKRKPQSSGSNDQAPSPNMSDVPRTPQQRRPSQPSAPDTATPSRMVGNFLVSERPHLSEFLDFVFERFDVAVWSSAQKHNVDALVDTVLASHHKSALVFVWHNAMCTDAGVHPVHSHKNLYLKELSKVCMYVCMYVCM